MQNKIPQLSKSRFVAGLQCHKRLYLESYHYEERDSVSLKQESIFDTGKKVGELAQKLYPNGILIHEDHINHEQAVESTKTVLADTKVRSLYEAAFSFDDVKIRVDILNRNEDGTFNLIEVKSSTSVKEEHLPDLAIQLYVLKGLNFKIKQCILVHIDSSYIYEGGDYDLKKLFSSEDVTEKILPLLNEIPKLLKSMKDDLLKNEMPKIDVGPHCTKPYDCTFYDYCHKSLPEDHISILPGLTEKLLQQFKESKIEKITQIPENFPKLKELYSRMRNVFLTNKPYFDKQIYENLARLKEPLYFMDFETLNPALPIYKGTRPYQQIPFQWSVHVLDKNKTLQHFEFLSDGSGDPRREFAETLLKILNTTGPILVYSAFEKTRLNEIAKLFPDLSNTVENVCSRLVDLLGLVRSYTYHKDYKGSFSIKTVLPALVPSLNYNELAVADGVTASNVFMKFLDNSVSEKEKMKIRKDLLAYCERDTLAMVEIYRFFMKFG